MKKIVVIILSVGLLSPVLALSAFAETGHNHGESHGHDAAKPDAHDDEHDGEDHDDDEHGHGHAEEQTTQIETAMAKQVGIETAIAQSQTLQLSIIAYGSLTTGPEQLSHVRARYSGMIRSVKPTLGDQIQKGDLLAEVESNESLKVYQITSPITGTVIQRHANTGEVTQEQVLFSIANFDMLWAEFRIYPGQQSLIKPGQSVGISVNDDNFKGVIEHIIPALDKPYQLARVEFDNRGKGLSPGLLVEGHIIVDQFKAELAVEKGAVQQINEKPGVFVQQREDYTFRPVKLGRQDDNYVEVLEGLSQQQRYVTKNSYLLKADIEKSEAEHAH